jgi:hypothetical protein
VVLGVFLALAILAGVASAALAWSQVRRAAAPTGGDPAALALALKRIPPAERLRELHRRAPPGSWEAELAAEALAAETDAGRVAVVNLALSEVEHTLSRGASWPRTGIRIALLGAGFFAFAAYLSDRDQIKWPLCIVGVGVVAALSCVEAARSAERHATNQRRAIDDLVAATFGDTGREDSGAPRQAATAAHRPGPGPGAAHRQRRRGARG